MNRKTAFFLILVIILAAVGVSLLAYPKLPDEMASHWNLRGEVDGRMEKSICVWLMPVIMLGLTGMFFGILLIDPLRKNIDKFLNYYAGFVIVFNLFLLVLHGWMILWNLDIQISSNVIIPIATACLIFYSGIVMSNVKPNWFIGIRTPWTLSNEIVWQKTHKLGGILFRIAAIIILLGALFPQYLLIFMLAPLLSVSLVTLIYSLVIWKKLKTD
ncbi:MAG: SdpI family protein [Planctomycetota bacterium]|jgi:uncharacterized membrane protein